MRVRVMLGLHRQVPGVQGRLRGVHHHQARRLGRPSHRSHSARVQ